MSDEERKYDLREESLLEDAQRRTGLEDFGEPAFLEGLRVQLETFEGEGNLSRAGRKSVRRWLLEWLENRLRIEKAHRDHPEIREETIRRPMYLTGLPRTGTSALVNLLARDDAARPLLFWEGRFPTPYEGLEEGERDPRLVALEAALERGRAKNPDFDKIHYTRAEGPEECVQLLAHTFRSVQLGMVPLMEPYMSFLEAQDQGPIYRYYADLLRMVQWQRPGERWLLKSPCHLWAIDQILECFPDACIVQTHRDPIHAVPSYCSMIDALMAVREDFDREVLGRRVLEYLARSMERGLAARDEADPARFVDVRFGDFVDAPLDTVRGIYRAFGLPLAPEVERALREHVEKNPKGKHGAHEYDLEAYGLSESMIRDRFAFYVERFDLDAR